MQQNVQWAYFKKYFRRGSFRIKNILCETSTVRLHKATLVLYEWDYHPISFWTCSSWCSSVKRETLKLIETFLDKAEDQPQIGKQFVPPMMDPVLGDYARNVPDARESEVLSLFATIVNKYVSFFFSLFPLFYWLVYGVLAF